MIEPFSVGSLFQGERPRSNVHAGLGRYRGAAPEACPAFSPSLLVGALIIVSLFLFSKLIQRLGDLQISNVLHSIGDRGRAVISELFPPIAEGATPSGETDGTAVVGIAPGPVMQELRYTGPPRTIARIEAGALAKLAQQAPARPS